MVAAASLGGGGKGRKGKGIKMGLMDLPDAQPRGWGVTPAAGDRVNPHNIWTQQHPLRGGDGGPSGSSSGAGGRARGGTGNQWAKGGGGQLANELSAIRSAWSK